VRTIESPGVRARVWLLVLAMVLVGMAILVVVRPALQRSQDSADPYASAGASKSPMPRATPAVKARAPSAPDALTEPRPPKAGSARKLEPAEPPESASDTAPAATEPEEAGGQPSGIALFPPPGTKPIKRGIIVPDDVELPPGYVRHYQTTDDGHQLPPILMFHPDFHPVDDNGEPIPVPDDRVVPPEMAPANMAIQILEVPEDAPPPAGQPGRSRNEPASPP
jgi:hypothetical protein